MVYRFIIREQRYYFIKLNRSHLSTNYGLWALNLLIQPKQDPMADSFRNSNRHLNEPNNSQMKFTYLFLFLLPFVIAACKEKTTEYNVIYITFDDMCPDWGIYGDQQAHTPRLDDFGREAVVFHDAHAQVTLSNPSRISIMSGLRPSTTGFVTEEAQWLDIIPAVTSLPKHFRDHGWYTSAVGKIFDAASGPVDSAFIAIRSAGEGITGNNDALEALREAAAQDKPFFLAIGYHHSQLPWVASESSRRYYKPEDFSIEHRTRETTWASLSDDDIRLLMRSYYATITDADSLFGQLISEIKNLGLYQNTIILVGSFDNGFSHGYHGRWGTGGLTDRETRVPMIIRVPGLKGNGKISSALTELVDLYPTLVDLCKLPPPAHRLEGHSLKRQLQTPSGRWKKAVYSHHGYNIQNKAVKTSRYTLIRRDMETYELYHRRKDPLNLKNIADENPEIVLDMINLLEEGWENSRPRRRWF
jgi:iduronate 2-sulfatase